MKVFADLDEIKKETLVNLTKVTDLTSELEKKKMENNYIDKQIKLNRQVIFALIILLFIQIYYGLHEPTENTIMINTDIDNLN